MIDFLFLLLLLPALSGAATPVMRSTATPSARSTSTPVTQKIKEVKKRMATFQHSNKPAKASPVRSIFATVPELGSRPAATLLVSSKPARFQLTMGGGLSFPDSVHFKTRAGYVARIGTEVFVARVWTLGIRGRLDQNEWMSTGAPLSEVPESYQLTRTYSTSVISRLLFAERGTRPYLLGGIGVFKSDADGFTPSEFYPLRGSVYSGAFGVEFDLNAKCNLKIEYELQFLEDRTSHRVTQLSELALSTGLGFD